MTKERRIIQSIHWQTGEPEEDGEVFLVSLSCGCVREALYSISEKIWRSSNMATKFPKVIAWCKLSDIEPYKEKAK